MRKYISVLKDILFISSAICFVVCCLFACASIGNPGGGPMDYDSPKYVSSLPERNAMNYDKKKIEIYFDELINVDKPSEKVIVTPPQKQNPIIRSLGRKISVELKDSLWQNTTYTFDFTDAITDNTEKNILEGFTFAFSTGDVVDSLVISGRLLNADNLEPMPGITIGLHSNLEDSAFIKESFIRTTRTNELGRFWIRNVTPGTYRLYGLDDLNRDYKFDQPGEAIAFYDSLIVPTFRADVRQDTIWADTLKQVVDSIIRIPYTHFLPDDIVMFLFQEYFEKQFMARPDRSEPYKFSLPFNAPVSKIPEIELLNDPRKKDWFLQEVSSDKKKIDYWITDSLVYKLDTLHLRVNYLKSDSTDQLALTSDTISVFQRGVRKASAKKPDKKGKDKEEIKIDFLGISFSGSNQMDVFDTLKITFSEPLLSFDPGLIKIEEKVDTLWEARDFPIRPDSLNPRLFWVDKRWPYEKEYQISIDSTAFMSIYGKWNDKIQSRFKLKKEGDYGHLYVAIEGNGDIPGIGELLDGSDRVVRRSILKKGELSFSNLKPGKYYLRYIADRNGNGRWDTGNYAEKLQPEEVFYYPEFFDIRQDWEIEHSWNIHMLPVENQKPLDITKNKPKEKKNNKNASQQNNQQKKK